MWLFKFNCYCIYDMYIIAINLVRSLKNNNIWRKIFLFLSLCLLPNKKLFIFLGNPSRKPICLAYWSSSEGTKDWSDQRNSATHIYNTTCRLLRFGSWEAWIECWASNSFMGSYVLPSVVPQVDGRGAAHKFASVIWTPHSWKNNHCPVWCLAKWLLRDTHCFKV